MIEDKIEYLEHLITNCSIDDYESKIILNNAKLIFIENNINSFDEDIKVEIINNWNSILDKRINKLENIKKVL